MASSSSAFFCAFLLLSLSLSLPAESDPNLIKKTCKATPYYSLCLSSLKTDPTSGRADTKGLAAIMLGAASTNAAAVSSYLSSQLLSGGASSVPPAVVGPAQKAIRLCFDKYSSANDSLQSAMQDVAAEMYDYASVDVAAAAAYPDACRNAFKRAPAVYPTELAKREVPLKRMCAVVVGILNLLINQQPN